MEKNINLSEPDLRFSKELDKIKISILSSLPENIHSSFLSSWETVIFPFFSDKRLIPPQDKKFETVFFQLLSKKISSCFSKNIYQGHLHDSLLNDLSEAKTDLWIAINQLWREYVSEQKSTPDLLLNSIIFPVRKKISSLL